MSMQSVLSKSRIVIKDTKDIVALFPQTPEQIHTAVQQNIAEAKELLARIIELPHETRTFANTVEALDYVAGLSSIAITGQIVHIMAMIHPDEQMRTAAQQDEALLNDFHVESLGTNKALYDALKAYAEQCAPREQLTEQQRYYLHELLADYKRAGLDLNEEQRNRIRELQKEITVLSTSFSHAIAADNSTISMTRAELDGLSEEFIGALPRTEDGLYKVGVDYPTYYTVIEACSVETTRQQLYRAFQNRAHPANVATLQEILVKRAELARILGFENFAQLNLADCMAHDTAIVETFLYALLEKAHAKEDQEFALLFQNLPSSVTLQDDKIKPWDLAYIKAVYKKKHFALNEQEVAEYFPMDYTVEALLDIYRAFFNIELTERPIEGLWHEEVRLLEVHTKGHAQLLGYLLLDLHPRANKYSHACECTIIPAVVNKNDATQIEPAVALVIANFPRATANQPALWHREQAVQTFFHEFGHALHDILGRTHYAGTAGTNVKRDFVELPSQMLEEWLADPDMLKKLSKHYKTGQPLPDELIETIKTIRTFDSGYWTQRQIFLSLLSLAYYQGQDTRTPYEIMQQLYTSTSRYVAFEPDTHFYAAFGHLPSYAARYYGYLWSKVFALDLFKEIEKHGLLNSTIGEKYIREVIGQGGSKDPNELLRTFLGREPNQDAFLAYLGFTEKSTEAAGTMAIAPEPASTVS